MPTKEKKVTQFDVYNAMPEGTIDIFMHTAGGRSLGKKNSNNAIIEVLVDDETLQNFCSQKLYGYQQNGKKKYYIMYAIDADEYEKQRELLNRKQKPKRSVAK